MRVVVAGGAGFLGSHLCERLLTDGAEVICLDNFATGRPDNVSNLRTHPRFELGCHDVTNFVHVAGPVDAVLHLASPASPLHYRDLPLETLMAGALGTRNLLGLARAKKARFLLASTSEVYGDPLVHPQTESYWGNVNPVGPRSMYDEAKRYAEALTTAYRITHETNTGIVRIFNTYGPRMRIDDGRAIPAFVAQALRGQPVTVAGDGSQTRSLCYVDDLVDGVLRMLRTDLPGPVNLGNPREMTILELAQLVVELCGTNVPITFVPRPVDDPMVRRPDITLARSQLGWEPRVDLRDGLAVAIAWFADALNLPAQAMAGRPRRSQLVDEAIPAPRRPGQDTVGLVGLRADGAAGSTT
ncbi:MULTISPECIES: UDP-glucuronic acid decarboxylase family protein [unclassified Pseudofrankia]|uniref:UDP-glucuronic acid decarboxylase family protein n=1 Tax=unclassified Pseudofrankia TaxID=2994372 RepID=UPI0009F512F9|nr:MULTISPECIES: UDP-glucuronic acid decarboxylase family protein [unclassified Pseudofrankia]MDT3443985.1 SDR family oxidoreductase [Pseudofrankia sp. BMG5.37]